MDLNLANKIKVLQLNDKSRKEILSELSISDTTLSKYSSFIKKNLLTPEESLKIEEFNKRRHRNAVRGSNSEVLETNTYSYLKRRNRELNEEIRKLRGDLQKLSSPLAELKPYDAGQLCELYALYRLKRAGFEAFRPETTSKALDILIFNKNDKVVRCEVKGASRGTIVSFSRTGFSSNQGNFVTSRYSEDDNIDIVILVLLEFEQIFIGTYKEINAGGKQKSLSPSSELFRLLNNFDVINQI